MLQDRGFIFILDLIFVLFIVISVFIYFEYDNNLSFEFSDDLVFLEADSFMSEVDYPLKDEYNWYLCRSNYLDKKVCVGD